MTSPTTQAQAREAVELPELPAPQLEVDVWVAYHDGRRGFYNSVCEPVEPLYTADHMRAYGLSVSAAKQEELDKMREVAKDALDFMENMDPDASFNPPTASWAKLLTFSLRAALSPIQGAAHE